MLFDESVSIVTKIVVPIVITVIYGGVMFLFLHFGFPHIGDLLFMRRRKYSAGYINSFEVVKKVRRISGGPNKVWYYPVFEYSFELENNEYYDTKLVYKTSLFGKLYFENKFDYGAEFNVFYDRNDPKKNVPMPLFKWELIFGIPFLLLITAAFGFIVYLELFAVK